MCVYIRRSVNLCMFFGLNMLNSKRGLLSTIRCSMFRTILRLRTASQLRKQRLDRQRGFRSSGTEVGNLRLRRRMWLFPPSAVAPMVLREQANFGAELELGHTHCSTCVCLRVCVCARVCDRQNVSS